MFIVGHWRSGTTYLHELLTCDDRFATPTTYQCFAANHFLLTDGWLPRLIWFLVPSRRPMDNVQVGWQAPQEDEFALCSLGIPSPYLRIAFPNDSVDYLRYLDMQGVDDPTLQAWQAALRWFLQSMTYATGRQLVLKSPTHTARLGILAQMFPRAKFLHIVRRSPDDLRLHDETVARAGRCPGPATPPFSSAADLCPRGFLPDVRGL